MKRINRSCAPVLLLLPFLLSGCLGMRTNSNSGGGPRDLRRFQALERIGKNKEGANQTIYLDRIRTGFWKFGFIGGMSDFAGDVECRYTDTAAPKIKRDWVLPYIIIPIPGQHFVYVKCSGSDKPVPIRRFYDDDGALLGAQRFAEAWSSLARLKSDPAEFRAVVEGFKRDGAARELPEEARQYRAQAEAAVREKKFWEAADAYDQAIAAAPWWPQGRYNLSLIAAEIFMYDVAIDEMEKYLQLVPDAENARKLQDKIYEWKAKVKI